MTVAYIAIGSNLASPLEQVNAALKLSFHSNLFKLRN